MKKIVVFGATSKIASETVKRFLETEAVSVFLVGRNHDALRVLVNDFEVRKHKDSKIFFEVCDYSKKNVESVLLQAKDAMNGISGVIVAQGVLTPQDTGMLGEDVFKDGLAVNIEAVSNCLMSSCKYLQYYSAQDGFLMLLSSVAADRAKKSNYIYGATKAYQSYLIQGLRLDYDTDFRVFDIHLGPVSTPMTAHLKQGLLFANPSVVGKNLVDLVNSNNKGGIYYIPSFWFFIMLIIRHIPYSFFRKISF